MSRYLLDTHIFLWWCGEDPRLGTRAKAEIANSESKVFVSVVTAWEIVLKHRIGRLHWPFSREADENVTVSEIVETCGFEQLDLTFRHAEELLQLPRHHGDPFDHLLIAQAKIEDLTLVTKDRVMSYYEVPLLQA